MTPGELGAAIRGIPGINSVTRKQGRGIDRLYLHFSVAVPVTSVWIDLCTCTLEWDKDYITKWHPGMFWRSDPHNLGARALGAVREVLAQFRTERIAELKGVKACP